MIRIVQSISAVTIPDGTLLRPALIPASASLNINKEYGEQGWSFNYDFSFRMEGKSAPDDWLRPLILALTLDDGETVELGTTDIPVRLTIREEDTISASCTWQRAV